MKVVRKALIDRRMRGRLVRHHLPMALVSMALVFGFAAINESRDENTRLSMGTAYAGLLLLGATLFTGPLNVLRSRANPVSTDLRRDLGVWAAIVGLAHVVAGLRVHMGGDPWVYFFYQPGGTTPRFDVFGWANWIGLAAAVILVFLLALSNDYTLRTLGRTRWKTLQRLNYVLALAVVVHGVVYQGLENRSPNWVALLVVIVAFFTLVQAAGVRVRLTQRREKPT